MTPPRKTLIPTVLTVQLDVRADSEQAVRDALLASLMALRQGVQPNTLWGDGFCVGIRTGGSST
jgi:hypothetical protein